MAEYRIYELDSAGHILSARNFTCDTDEAALAEAGFGLRVSEQVEVWIGTRCVGRVSGNRSQSG
jgi:hypothetical protein